MRIIAGRFRRRRLLTAPGLTTRPITDRLKECLFERIEVNGEGTHPLYAWLKASAPGLLGSEAIKWNFTKFLLDRNGRVVERFASTTEPAEIAPAIARLL